MALMSGNNESPSRDLSDSLLLTNWILDSVATCHMTPQILDFIPGLLEDTDKHIKFTDRHHVMAKQKGQVQIKMWDDNRDLFLRHFTTYFWHQIYVTGYFQLLC